MTVTIDEAPPRVRGSNAARRAATREKLLNACVKHLAKHGYYATSTVMVAELAGVSRGAMLHQFPTKLDLMIATAEHISHSFGQARKPKLTPIDDPHKRFEVLLDIIWEETRTPSGIALLEIMMATRSDPALAERLADQRDHIDQQRADSMWRLAQKLGVKDRAAVDAMVTFDTAALRGLSVSAMFIGKPKQIDAALDLLREYRRLMLAKLVTNAEK